MVEIRAGQQELAEFSLLCLDGALIAIITINDATYLTYSYHLHTFLNPTHSPSDLECSAFTKTPFSTNLLTAFFTTSFPQPNNLFTSRNWMAPTMLKYSSSNFARA